MNSPAPSQKRWRIPPSILRITVLVVLIIVVVGLVVCFKRRRDNSENVSDLFGDRFDIQELPQVSDLYDLSSVDAFRSYNPCLFTCRDTTQTRENVYWVYRMCNFALCPGTKNIWNDKFLERIKSHTLIENPDGELFIVSQPNVSGRKCPQGCQDARTFVCQNRLYLVCNDTSGPDCRREMYILELDVNEFKVSGEQRRTLPETSGRKKDKGKRTHIREVSPLSMRRLNAGFDNDRDQKNWMPLIMDDQIYFIYSINPHVILRYHPGADRSKFPGHNHIHGQDEIVNCEKVAETTNPKLPDNLRGGGQIIQVRKWRRNFDPKLKRGQEIRYSPEDLYLGVVHTRDSELQYSTYFYAFETIYPFRVKYISRGFVFGEAGSHSKRIQFASGLAQLSLHNPDHGIDENWLYITYGENDCISKLCIIKEEDVLRALHPV